MKRSIKSSVLAAKPKLVEDLGADQAANEEPVVEERAKAVATTGLKSRMGGGSGSAWKAGAQADTQTLLNEKRAETAENILSGKHVLQLQPNQIMDEIGSDRRKDWKSQQPFKSLSDSIEQNGQDTPIQVWPADPHWKPDELDPEDVGGVPFLLIVGRRRHAILSKLGRPIRAILADPSKRGGPDDLFEMLFMRFRENEERENLGAFERLLSVGEMFERYETANSEQKTTAVAFAKIIGVHESHVSRGKTVFKVRDEILHACKNVYELSHRELEKAVADLSGAPKPNISKAAKPKKLTVSRKLGSKKLSLTSQAGKISISSIELNLDKAGLEGLSDVVATYLQEQEPKK